MVLLLALHLVVGAGLMAATRSLADRRLPFLIAGLAPLATLTWLATRLPSVIDGDVRTETVEWIPQLGVDLVLRLDGFAALMLRARRRHRCARRRLLGELLRQPLAARRPPARPADPLRRGDDRARPRRRRARPLRLLGADVDHVVPAHRQRPHPAAGPRRRPPGVARDRRRSPGDARRTDRPRPAGRHVPPQRHPRRPSNRHGRRRGARADPARRLHQVGADAVPLVAAGGDGCADAGEHVPALGDDGQGRRLPRRPVCARLRRRDVLAPDGRHGRRGDADRRRAAGPAPDRPQAAARRRHGEPARLDDRRLRLGHTDGGGRRQRDAARPRRLQGGGVHGRRHRRPPARDPRRPRPATTGSRVAARARRRRRRRRLDGRRPVAARVHRQGGRLRRLHRPGHRRHARAHGDRRRVRPHRGVQHPLRCWRRRAAGATRHCGTRRLTRSAAPRVRAPGRGARRGHDPLRRGARSRRPARHRRGECTRTGDDGGAPRAVARPRARAVPVPARPLHRSRPLRSPLEGRHGARRRCPPTEGRELLPSDRWAASRPSPTASPPSPNPDRSRSTSA